MLWTRHESIYFAEQSREVVTKERIKARNIFDAISPAEILKPGNPDSGFHQQEMERKATRRGNAITAFKKL